MSALEILRLILALAPTGINLTKEILALIAAIEGAIHKLPKENQAEVAGLMAKAVAIKT